MTGMAHGWEILRLLSLKFFLFYLLFLAGPGKTWVTTSTKTGDMTIISLTKVMLKPQKKAVKYAGKAVKYAGKAKAGWKIWKAVDAFFA